MKPCFGVSSALFDDIQAAFAYTLLIGFMMCFLSACTEIHSSPISAQPAKLSEQEIANIIASPDRSPEDRQSDVRRKPAELLSFIGIRPAMTVLDISAGGGYTTELIARSVGPDGHVYGQSAPVDSTPKPESVSASKLDKVRLSSPEALSLRANHASLNNITPLVLPFDNPIPADLANAHLDLVTFIYNYHDLGHMSVDRNAMNKHIFSALKHGGLYIIVDHAGRAGTGISESATLHRIEEEFLIKEVTSAGFKLESSDDFFRNPLDPRDQNTPLAGQTKDGFILKFIKP